MNEDHRIVAVTPAGRAHYLNVLSAYILNDDSIAEWQLWDNCRKPTDRAYIEAMARDHAKITIVRAPQIDGTNRAINQFYRGLTDPRAFYIKLDDDIVYLPDHFGQYLYAAAKAEFGQFTYWSPLVINNAICSWLIKHHSQMRVPAQLVAAATCSIGWRDPFFAEQLHRAFIESHRRKTLGLFEVPNFEVSLARFSINCIGFFGSDVVALGETFCPLGTDDEEWISAVLPSKTRKPGRIIGDLLVAHFSFFTQEFELLRSSLLDEYCRIAGVKPFPRPPVSQLSYLRQILKRKMEVHILGRYRRHDRITPHSKLSNLNQ
jgi:hypothetical protein